MYEHISYEVEGSVARITLDRPSLTLAVTKELLDVVIATTHNPEVRCIVFDSSGKNFFLGGDLGSFGDAAKDADALLAQMTALLDRAISLLYRSSVPTISVVNGAAAGAGMGIALQADFVVAEENAYFIASYTGAGLSPDTSTTYFLPRLIGERRAKDMLITNRKVDAQQAQDWGMINSVVPTGEGLQEGMALALRLAAGPTQAYGSVKRLIGASFGNSLDAQISMEAELIGQNAITRDGQEGIRAFIEKRKPEFTGNR